MYQGFNLSLRALLFAALFVTSSPAMQASEPQRGGTMVMIVQPEPATLASYLSVAGNVCPVACQVYEGLVGYDWDLKPVPKLAKSWEISPDGLTITFHLREGVTFHNGAKFTSADVQYSFMEVLKKVNPRAPVVLADGFAAGSVFSNTDLQRIGAS